MRLCTRDGVRVDEATLTRRDPARTAVHRTIQKKRKLRGEQQLAKLDFHKRSQQQARIEGALALLDLDVDPLEAVVHIKSSARIERSLHNALDWLQRFAAEFKAREQFSN